MSVAVNAQVSVCLTLARAITQAKTLDRTCDVAFDALQHSLGVGRAAVALVELDGVTRVTAYRGVSAALRHALERHTSWQAVDPGRPVVLPDVGDEPSLAPLLPALGADGVSALAIVPLVGVDAALGSLLLCFDAQRTLAPDEAQFAELIASQVAFAIDRSRAEEALDASSRAAQQLAAIVRSSGDAIVSKNLDGIIMSWNQAAERMFGYSAQEAVGRSITIIIPSDRLPEEDALLARIRRGEAVEMETIRRRKDGTLLPIGLTVSPVRDRRGRIIGASKVARDISIRVRADAEREELHRRLTTLVAASASLLTTPAADSVGATTLETARQLLVADGYAIWSHDANGTWRAATHDGISPAFASRVISPEPTASGAVGPALTGTRAVVDVEQDPLLERQRQAYADEGIRSMLVCPMTLGRERAGTLVFYFRAPRTFSEFEIESGQTLANLAASALRMADLYEQLRAERNAADTAARVKDEFLATLSHELRTPLNAILGYAQMLSTGALAGDRRASALAVLLRNAEALRQIIDDVLDVARITTGKLRLHVQPLDLGSVVADAVATVQPGAAAKAVALELDIPPGVPHISGDRDRLQQVAWNLLSNAVKFTPRLGHVRVSIEHGQGAVRLVVRDDGQGIDAAFLPHIFERFRQADSRFSREHGGLGLGLAIVRELVELHGGTVSARSGGPGTGATFTVSLPAVTTRADQRRTDPRARPVQPAEGTAPIPRRLEGMRILAVDNEPDGLGLLCTALEEAGAVVTPASSAAEALEALNREAFDALVADIGMPRMDGLEMIRRVRSVLPDPASRVPAAAVTAYAAAADRADAIGAGYQLHIAKPVEPATLVSAVASLVGR